LQANTVIEDHAVPFYLYFIKS